MKHVNFVFLLAHYAILATWCNDMTILSITTSDEGMQIRIISEIQIEAETLGNPQIAATPDENPNQLDFEIYAEDEQQSCEPLQACYQTFVISASNSMNAYCPLLLHGVFDVLFDVFVIGSEESMVRSINFSIPIRYEDEWCEEIETDFDMSTLGPTMRFFTDSTFETEMDEDEMYSLSDVCYVELTMPLLGVQLQNVWLCTTSPLETVLSVTSNGCFEDEMDNDGPYWIIRNHGTAPSLFNASILAETETVTQSDEETIIRFEFTVPESLFRDRLYVDVQLALEQDDELSNLYSVFGYINIHRALLHFEYRHHGKHDGMNVLRPKWFVVLEIMTAILILFSCILMISIKIFKQGEQQRVDNPVVLDDDEEYDPNKQLISDDSEDFEDLDKAEVDPLDESY